MGGGGGTEGGPGNGETTPARVTASGARATRLSRVASAARGGVEPDGERVRFLHDERQREQRNSISRKRTHVSVRVHDRVAAEELHRGL